MILTVTPNPCVDKTVFIDTLTPGTFMRGTRCTTIPGGKGVNVSRAVKAMGRCTRAMIIAGGHTGNHVAEMIAEQDGVECIRARVDSPTRTITTVLEENIHRQTAFFEPGSRVTQGEYTEIVETFGRAVTGAKAVALSGTVSDPSIAMLYRDLIPIAKTAGALTLLDSHGAEFAAGLDAGPYMAKPNLAELQELVGYSLETDEAKWRAIDALHVRGIELVVLSLGKNGAMLSHGERLRVHPPKIREVNPVGSGDALVAGFAIGLTEGMPLRDMAALGCAMGTANAMSWEIGHFTAHEVTALLPQVSIETVT